MIVLDCLGQRCPLPIIALAKAFPALAVGDVIRVLADDPAAGGDIAAWCRLRHQLLLPAPPQIPHAFDVQKQS